MKHLSVPGEYPRNEINAMAYIPVPNTAQLEFIYSWDSQVVENVLHYELATNPSTSDLQVLTTAAIAWWTANLRAQVSSAASLITVRATSLTTQTSPVVEDTTGLPLAGTGSATAVPNNVTVSVKLITAARGRSFRGRVYHIGLTQAAVAANTVGSSTRTALRNAYLAAFTLGSAPVWGLVVASRYSNNAPRTTGIVTAVSDISVNPTVDSQRRRLPERGA